MSFDLADRVQESVTVTGTGNVTLGGAITGFQQFNSIMVNGDTTWYAIVDNTAGTWEVGVGTWNSGNTLSRTTVLASSNSGSLVSFVGNICNVFMTLPAGKAISLASGAIHWFAGSNTTAVANGTYIAVGYAPYSGTITTVKAVVGPSAVGSFTVVVQINSTPVTGVNVVTVNSSSVQSFTATAANTFAVGDTITIVIASATSSPVGGWIDIEFIKA